MKIAIFGASGATGQHLVAGAIERDFQVTAFVRTPAKLRASSEKLSLVQGDVADTDAVMRAVSGQDAVLSALGVGKPLQHDQAVVDGVGHIVRAMQSAGVRRLVYLSASAVRESRARAGFVTGLMAATLIRHEIRDHEAKEGLVRSSDLDWTIVRAPLLTNGPRTSVYRSGEGITARSPLPMLSRADVAEFMLAQLADESFVRKAPLVLR
jgi:putative NADH-flavin reductase